MAGLAAAGAHPRAYPGAHPRAYLVAAREARALARRMAEWHGCCCEAMTDLGPRRGRARAAGQERRQCRLHARLSKEELADLTAAALEAGMSPTGYMTAVAISAARGEPLVLVDERRIAIEELANSRVQVVKVGVNLNQAVAALNATGRAPDVLGFAVRACAQTIAKMDALIVALHKELSK